MRSCGLCGEKYKKLLEACKWPRFFTVRGRGHKNCQDQDLASRCAKSLGKWAQAQPRNTLAPAFVRKRDSRPRLLRTWRRTVQHLTTCEGPRPHVDLNDNDRSKQRMPEEKTLLCCTANMARPSCRSITRPGPVCATNSRANTFWDTFSVRRPEVTEGFTAAPALRVQARAVSQIWQAAA